MCISDKDKISLVYYQISKLIALNYVLNPNQKSFLYIRKLFFYGILFVL